MSSDEVEALERDYQECHERAENYKRMLTEAATPGEAAFIQAALNVVYLNMQVTTNVLMSHHLNKPIMVQTQKNPKTE